MSLLCGCQLFVRDADQFSYWSRSIRIMYAVITT